MRESPSIAPHCPASLGLPTRDSSCRFALRRQQRRIQPLEGSGLPPESRPGCSLGQKEWSRLRTPLSPLSREPRANGHFFGTTAALQVLTHERQGEPVLNALRTRSSSEHVRRGEPPERF